VKMTPVLRLKPGREKSLLRRHPWVFSGAVAGVEGTPEPGATVKIANSSGEFLAWGAYSPQSQIRARVWSWDPKEQIDAAFFRLRLERAFAARRSLLERGETDALRLVHAESDGLPGLVIDRYAGVVVVQFLSQGPEHWRETLADLTQELTGAASIYERSDVDVRQLEGLAERACPLRGAEPPEMVEIREHGLRFWVGVSQGHKTGYYLDQRHNRLQVRALSRDREVLDCFSYTGGFTTNALAGGAASVTAIDSSSEALRMAEENLRLNDLPGDRASFLEGDVFQELRKFRDSRRSFDLIVLDPPKFAQTAAQAERAARGYKDINLLAFKLLRPGGLLVTFSCSGGISEDLFQKIVAGAALDAGIEAQIVQRMHQGADHPVALNFPEGAYLKGLVVRV
jgi:23S rRNA (cytosine1962-C5)-methyltransferase